MHIEELDLEAVSRKEARDYLASVAVSLSSVRKELGGSHGEIVDEFGDLHPLSVAEWSHRLPETRLTIYFTYQQDNMPEGFRGSIYPSEVLSFVRAPADRPESAARPLDCTVIVPVIATPNPTVDRAETNSASPQPPVFSMIAT